MERLRAHGALALPKCGARLTRAPSCRVQYVEGTPLNRLAGEMEARGIKPGSPESKLAGRRILEQLTLAFGRMMLGAGFIHGDPHPGNIFVQEGAKVALIDCGQVKQISTTYRLQLAEAILLVNEWQESGGSPALVAQAQEKMAQFGVTFVEDAPPEAAPALALLLFGDPDTPMPAGFSHDELSPNSPIKQISSFPQVEDSDVAAYCNSEAPIKRRSRRSGCCSAVAYRYVTVTGAGAARPRDHPDQGDLEEARHQVAARLKVERRG